MSRSHVGNARESGRISRCAAGIIRDGFESPCLTQKLVRFPASYVYNVIVFSAHTYIYTHTDTRKFTYIYVYTTRELMLPVNSCANSPLGENSFYSALTVKLISSLVDGHMVHTRFSLLRKRSR